VQVQVHVKEVWKEHRRRMNHPSWLVMQQTGGDRRRALDRVTPYSAPQEQGDPCSQDDR